MTNEEAVRMLKAKLECMTRDVSGTDYNCNHLLCDECRLNYEQGDMGEQKEYTRMSIEALEREFCEDTISREQTKSDYADWYGYGYRDNAFYKYLCSMPPVTSQPKMGHWIRMKAYEKWGCSECSTVFRFTFKEHYYCPNCGAKMVEPQEGSGEE